MRAIFIDKDGTLIENVPYNVEPQLITLTWLAGPALKLLQQRGFALFVVTNQPGIARGLIDEAAMKSVHSSLMELLAPFGVMLTGFYYCPHSPDGTVGPYAIHCTCRKPMPGMLQRAAIEHGVELDRSWMIGDILDDVEAGMRAGCRTVLIDNGNETDWTLSTLRTPNVFAPNLYSAATQIMELDAEWRRSQR